MRPSSCARRWSARLPLGPHAGQIGFHGGKVEIERPRVRVLAGKELALPSWERAVEEDWLGQWAMNLMLINVSTRKIRRAVRLPEGDVPAPAGAGVSKSAASRHFVALSAARMREWLGSDLSALDLLVVQIDGIHITEHLVLVAAIGIDGEGVKHPLGLVEGATENAAVVQALVDSPIGRGLDPALPRLFIIDGSKALAKAIRRSFGRHTPIQRCQVHKARNIMERLPKTLHSSVRRALRQAWELDDPEKAEKLIRNLAQRLERDAPGVSTSILEGPTNNLLLFGWPSKLITKGYQTASLLISKRKSRNLQMAATASPISTKTGTSPILLMRLLFGFDPASASKWRF
jgi:putative transposase